MVVRSKAYKTDYLHRGPWEALCCVFTALGIVPLNRSRKRNTEDASDPRVYWDRKPSTPNLSLFGNSFRVGQRAPGTRKR